MNSSDFNKAQSNAERYRGYAIHRAGHALEWLQGSRDKGTGSIPYRYDLTEAEYLLQGALKDCQMALKSAVDPSHPCPGCGYDHMDGLFLNFNKAVKALAAEGFTTDDMIAMVRQTMQSLAKARIS